MIAGYFADALLADRTGLELAPAPDGSVFFISVKPHATNLPGLLLRPRNGVGPLAPCSMRMGSCDGNDFRTITTNPFNSVNVWLPHLRVPADLVAVTGCSELTNGDGDRATDTIRGTNNEIHGGP